MNYMEHVPSSLSGAREAVVDLASRLKRTNDRMKRFATENEARIEGVIEAVEVVGAAFGISYANARYGVGGQPVQIAGMDSDLVAGGVLMGLALFEAGGKFNDHIYALGSGCLSAWATREGYALGAAAVTAAATTAAAKPAVTAGVAPAGAYYTAGVAPAGAYQQG